MPIVGYIEFETRDIEKALVKLFSTQRREVDQRRAYVIDKIHKSFWNKHFFRESRGEINKRILSGKYDNQYGSFLNNGIIAHGISPVTTYELGLAKEIHLMILHSKSQNIYLNNEAIRVLKRFL